MNAYTLSNGVRIPAIGLGTWQTPDGETAVAAVSHAIACGGKTCPSSMPCLTAEALDSTQMK